MEVVQHMPLKQPHSTGERHFLKKINIEVQLLAWKYIKNT
jgi:hypothetical protein